MHKPLVSIIVPIYKVEPYLRRCLDSLMNQIYAHLEIILVDDGSPDNSPQICDEYAAKDNRIVVVHKKNGGLSDARNSGTNIAKGDYLYYLDSDDELPFDSIQTFVDYAKAYPEAEIIVGKMHCPQNEDIYKEQLFDSVQIFRNNIEFRKFFSSPKDIFPANACNKLIKKDFIFKNSLFFQKGLIHEDQLWMFFVSQVTKYVVCINKQTYIRYINPGSITNGSPNDAKIYSWGRILKKIFSEINQPYFVEYFYKYYKLLDEMYSIVPKKHIPLYKDVWKECIHCARRNGHFILSFLVSTHKSLHKKTKGHGTGFLIWLLLTKRHNKPPY